VYGSDDALACRAAQGVRRGVSYGFGPEADLRAQPLPAGNGCALSCHGQDLGDLRLAVPGDHNMLNALACVAVLMELGIPFDAIASELEQVGLPKRRFETVVSTGATRVISDYAHHPSEIRALVRTARSLAPGRLLAVFQPHRYTRTLALGPDFPHAFRGIDDLVLTPVYAASEKPLPGGDLADLYVRFRQTGTTDGPVVRLADSLDAAWSYLCRAVTADDWLLIVGAGDIEILADRARRDAGRLGGGASTAAGMVESLRAAGVSGDTLLAANEPLAARTSLGVGGVAEVWAEVATEDDLARLAGWCRQRACPLQLLGAGSNVLISDLGVPGVTARLTGRPFREIRASAPGTVCAGAAVPLPRLLDWCEAHHLSGLECLEGIPATVGGAVAMNAGAWGDAIGPHVTRIHALNRAGEPCIVHEKDLTPEYRSIKGFGDRIITSVVFALAQAGPGTVRERRSVCAGRREWWRGLRSAGSVFRNPPGDFAGRLCDASGLKGRTVGGAQVSEQHANVIVTGSSATASDVEALMMQMETAVRRDSDIRLEREIVLWPPRIR
jgi:UDP-N-acetylmuramate--alanine ligase